jgi:hypothetical protein
MPYVPESLAGNEMEKETVSFWPSFIQGLFKHATTTFEGKTAAEYTRSLPGQGISGLLGSIAGERYDHPL